MLHLNVPQKSFIESGFDVNLVKKTYLYRMKRRSFLKDAAFLTAASGTVSGCRVFQFKAGEPGFKTWVRLVDGEIQQKLYLNNHQITIL